MATAFIAVNGRHGTNAQNFYQMFPAEPVVPAPQSLPISRVIRVQPAALDRLMAQVASRRDRKIVVVSHGVPSQLAIHVLHGVRIGVDEALVDTLLSDDANQAVAQRLGSAAGTSVSANAIGRLRNSIRQVQQIGIQRLELRACRVGRSPTTLRALKRLFGASSASAPVVFDGYSPSGNVRPTTDAGVLSRWQSQHAGHSTFGSAPDRFFWEPDGSSDPPRIHSFAESWDGVRAFLAAKQPTPGGGNFRPGRRYHYHYQATMTATSSQVHGQRTFQNSFVFPGDAAYRRSIRRIT